MFIVCSDPKKRLHRLIICYKNQCLKFGVMNPTLRSSIESHALLSKDFVVRNIIPGFVYQGYKAEEAQLAFGDASLLKARVALVRTRAE